MGKEYSSLDSSGTESGSMKESCEQGFETFGSIKGSKLFNELSNCHPDLQTNPISWT
jgi:hypothetical protein